MTEPHASRPVRLWVPGLLFVSDDGELLRGRGVGRLVSAPGYPARALGAEQRLEELRHTLWLVERARVDDSMLERYALVLPEKLLDPDAQAHARRWLEELPVLCFSGAKWDRIVADDRLRVHRVAVSEHAGRVVLSLEGAGGGAKHTLVEVDLARLAEASAEASSEELGGRLLAARSMVDRLLRQVTGGALDEAMVIAAYQAATLLEPGYGYRGATDGAPATIEQVQYGARALEVAFAQIAPRAEAQRADAEAVLALLEAPRAEDEPMPSLPTYGEVETTAAKPLVLAAESVGRGGSFVVDGEASHELELGGEVRFFVARPDPWLPEIPPELARELERVLKERAPLPEWWVLVAIALLVAVAVVSFLLRG